MSRIDTLIHGFEARLQIRLQFICQWPKVSLEVFVCAWMTFDLVLGVLVVTVAVPTPSGLLES